MMKPKAVRFIAGGARLLQLLLAWSRRCGSSRLRPYIPISILCLLALLLLANHERLESHEVFLALSLTFLSLQLASLWLLW